MFATIFNCIAIIVCGILGTIFKKHINENNTNAILTGLAIVVASIGMNYAIQTNDTLCVIICMVLGILLGEALRLEERLEHIGEFLKIHFVPKSYQNSSFVESFVAGSLLYCIGSMAIIGSMQAGINGDPSIILSKSIIDGIASISFATSLGIGVVFSGISVLLYQGTLTLLAVELAPFLTDAVVTEISAVGGILMIGIAINMLGLKKIKVGNMLPAIFLPLLYLPLANWITSLF